MTEARLLELTEAEYFQMEEALSQTARGRAFLRMRDRHARIVAVDEFKRIAGTLERQVNRLSGIDPGTVPARGADGSTIQQELSAISRYVQQTRSDIAALRPADSGANRIEAATGELDAIVAATERATTDILNAAERITEWTARIPRTDPELAEVADAIEAWSIEILTACSFQDITGQRTTKVVNTLRYIEQRVNTMIEIWGVDRTVTVTGGGDFSVSHRKMNDERPDAHLLNGPQMDGEGVSQDDIDALFDSIATEMPQVFDRAEPAPPSPPPPQTQSQPTPQPKPSPQPKPAAKTSAAPAEPSGGGEPISQSDIDKLFA